MVVFLRHIKQSQTEMNLLIKGIIVTKLLASLTIEISLASLQETEIIFSNKNFSHDVRGFFGVILQTTELLSLKPDVASITNQRKSIPTTDWLVFICMASKQNRNSWKLKHCKVCENVLNASRDAKDFSKILTM